MGSNLPTGATSRALSGHSRHTPAIGAMITTDDGRAVRPDSGVGMELRVPGIGGPSAESVLGCEPGYAVTTWRSQDDARSRVCHTAAEYTTHAYDWRPLTSGSRSFAAWPLLLPFTVVNLSG